MRLTDVDKVYEIIVDQYHLKTEIQKLALRETLTKVPTIDVELVRHGKWISVHGWIYCSVCDKEPPNETNLETDYCPNCGARMDEVEDEYR